MRVQFCEVKKRAQAIKKMPWAFWIVKVTGGYMGFEDYRDYFLCVDHNHNKKHKVKKEKKEELTRYMDKGKVKLEDMK